MKLDHVGIEVLDLFTEELFYRTALGFSPRYRYVSRNSPGLRTSSSSATRFPRVLERPASRFPRTPRIAPEGNAVALEEDGAQAGEFLLTYRYRGEKPSAVR